MDKLLRVLQFFRVTDEQGNLSLTNIALVATLVRALLLPQLAVQDIVAVAATIAGYQFKRFVAPAPGEQEDVAALKAVVEGLQTKVVALQMGAQRK